MTQKILRSIIYLKVYMKRMAHLKGYFLSYNLLNYEENKWIILIHLLNYLYNCFKLKL